MNWTDRDPPETDPLLQMTIPHDGGGAPCRLEIDKLADGHYRVTVGTQLEAQELCRTPDLEPLLRHTYRLGVSRSFHEVLAALQQLSELASHRPAGSSTDRRPPRLEATSARQVIRLVWRRPSEPQIQSPPTR